ncbi:hypothetical protein Taro_027965 [Colocasia esculenta]|uniref:Equilibrative nucleotide transporter 1 n=1 Tax=Colocasia esculenta TaxID=4460 RepID=A0A843VLP2_COLES|nr:hypothetical protein [Colocasia esculenta]
MGVVVEERGLGVEEGEEGTLLLGRAPPPDTYHLAYAIYFTLGAGFLLPWNAFITAVDYFSYLYPDAPVDRVFAVAYMLSGLAFLIIMVVWWAHRSGASIRINSGLVLFVICLLVVPILDAAYVKGHRGLYGAYDVTIVAVVLSGVGDALVQGGVIGSAGELPERYMQAVVAGTAASVDGVAFELFALSCLYLDVWILAESGLQKYLEVDYMKVPPQDYLSLWRAQPRIFFSLVKRRVFCLAPASTIESSCFPRNHRRAEKRFELAAFVVAAFILPPLESFSDIFLSASRDDSQEERGSDDWGKISKYNRSRQVSELGVVVDDERSIGVLVSIMRILTKGMFPQDAYGLRKSANLYFAVSIVIMAICLVCYNVADRLPVVKYYKDLKLLALNEERNEKDSLTGSAWRSTLWRIIGRIKWFGFGIFLIYVVTLSIFPGYITQDVHSEVLKDWYSIILITGYNVFDLVGKCLPAVYMLHNENIAVAGSVARLLFFPLFLGCLHGPKFFRSEIPVTVLTCLLGLTNGYLTGILMILAPKSVPIQHAEVAGIAIVLFLVLGLAVGSIVSWFWVI